MTAYQACYLIFEHIHMEVHHPHWFQQEYTFRISHMYHHTMNKNKGYAFTTPTWDILYGTFPTEVLAYNWFAYLPIPVISFYFGTYPFSKREEWQKTQTHKKRWNHLLPISEDIYV